MSIELEYEYLNFLEFILKNGDKKKDRTGTGTFSTFGYQMRFDLSKGFPLFTTKKTSFRLIASELLWFIKGDTNIKYLLQHNNHIWDEWAFQKWTRSVDYNGPDMTDFGKRCLVDTDFNLQYQEQLKKFQHLILTDDKFAKEYGDLGNIYGKQWRDFGGHVGFVPDLIGDINEEYIPGVDQLKIAIETIKNNPDSRRNIVTAWNPKDVIGAGTARGNAELPPCHVLFQFYVVNNKLSCLLYQRSADAFLGSNFNITSYSLLTYLVAHECGLEVGEFIYSIGDAHIYSNHVEQVKEQLSRTPFELPTLWINPEKKSIFDIEMEDIRVENYQSHPAIKAPVAV